MIGRVLEMFKFLLVFGILLTYGLAWAAYLELSPSMGNVWWRTTSEGSKEFCPWGLWATAVAPFKQGHTLFWHPSFWDINPWPALLLLGGLSSLVLRSPHWIG